MMVAAGYHYRYAALGDLTLPASTAWLGTAEREALARLHDRGRRSAWLAGRWLLKQLLTERTGEQREAACREEGLATIEISSVDECGRRVRPRATRGGQLLSCSLSVSHSACGVLAAVGPKGMALGVDLVPQSGHVGTGFRAVWFTPEEHALLAARPTIDPAVVWGAKEAAYKALNQGEPFAPRRLQVDWRAENELICRARHHGDAQCLVRSWRAGNSEFAVLATCPRINMQQGISHD